MYHPTNGIYHSTQTDTNGKLDSLVWVISFDPLNLVEDADQYESDCLRKVEARLFGCDCLIIAYNLTLSCPQSRSIPKTSMLATVGYFTMASSCLFPNFPVNTRMRFGTFPVLASTTNLGSALLSLYLCSILACYISSVQN